MSRDNHSYASVGREPAEKSASLMRAWDAPGGGEHVRDLDHDHDNVAKWNQTSRGLLADAICVGIPLALLGFLIAVVRLNGQAVDDEEASRRWLNAISILGTLFPMFFAYVVGRLMYEASRWKLEKGTTLGLLEQLLGSRTLGGTLTTQFELRSFNLLGLALLVAWAFSPLGSQSMLRILEPRLEPEFTDAAVQYRDMNARTMLSDTVLGTSQTYLAGEQYFHNVAAMLNSVMRAPAVIRLDTMDLWGNVKIPFLPEAAAGAESDDWRDITWTDEADRFSAFAGLPMQDVPYGNATLEIESGYIELACSNLTLQLSHLNITTTDFDWTWGDGSRGGWSPPEKGNGTWQGVPMKRGNLSSYPDPFWSIALDRFVDYTWLNASEARHRRGLHPWGSVGDGDVDTNLENALHSPGLFVNETGIDAGPTRLLFQAEVSSDFRNGGNHVTAFCDVKQRYVETRISCQRARSSYRQNCTAVAQRPSRRQRPSENITHLSFPRVFYWISQRLPWATAGFSGGVTDMAITYLDVPRNLSLADDPESIMFQDTDMPIFSRRLAQLLNTYLVIYNFRQDPEQVQTQAIEPNATAAVTASEPRPVYRVSASWAVLGFLCCGVVLAGGVAGVVFAHLARGPDVLGFASTAVRDSKLMDVASDIGGLGGMEISRSLRDERVRYGYSELTLEGRPLVGVGREHETRAI